jgi:hypothetical protein
MTSFTAQLHFCPPFGDTSLSPTAQAYSEVYCVLESHEDSVSFCAYLYFVYNINTVKVYFLLLMSAHCGHHRAYFSSLRWYMIIENHVWMMLTEKIEGPGEKLVSLPLCPQHFPYALLYSRREPDPSRWYTDD